MLNEFLDSSSLPVHAARMEKAEAYRTYAEQCMELADRMPPDARPQLIQMAEAWLELARSELALVAATRGDQPQ